jgi:hypothetical protein
MRWAWDKLHSPAPVTEQLAKQDRARRGGPSTRPNKRARRAQWGRAQTDTGTSPHASPHAQALVLAKRAQLIRIRGAREAALAVGERRRATMLAVREHRIEAELAGEERSSGSRRHYGLDREREPYLPARDRHERGGSPANASSVRPTTRPDPAPSPGADESSAISIDGASARARERKSRVMDDARAVAEGRKRQLGYGPPP